MHHFKEKIEPSTILNFMHQRNAIDRIGNAFYGVSDALFYSLRADGSVCGLIGSG